MFKTQPGKFWELNYITEFQSSLGNQKFHKIGLKSQIFRIYTKMISQNKFLALFSQTQNTMFFQE